ncbi:MAG TPA: hypothetical protein VH089_03810 [Streptosporangiaceae bacterium]|nr:hypothetical protein [Streptosporangiaceae bacterium]
MSRAKDGVLTGPWWRVLSMAAPETAGSAEDDYAAIRPAALAAATAGCPLVVAWLSRGDGADLELITLAPTPAAPARRGKHAAPASASVASAPGGGGPGSPAASAAAGGPLLFPPGARAEPARDRAAELEQLVWAPCLAGPAALPESPPDPTEPPEGPGVFETALIALMRRPFGWLVVAEPTDLLAAETAGLRTELEILRRHTERRATGAVEQTERRLAERGTFGAAGLWRVQVLAGAASPGELDVLAPLLASAAELGPHPYRLRHTTGAHSLAAALAARHHDPADGAQAPFFVTAGTLTALAGLPRISLPGLELIPPPGADLTAELLAAPVAADLEASGPESEAPELPATPVAPIVTAPWAPDLNGHANHKGNGHPNGHSGQNGSAATTELPADPEAEQGPPAEPEPPADPEAEQGPPAEPDAPADPNAGGADPHHTPSGLVSPANPPSVNKADDPVPEQPVADVTGRMVELGAPVAPGREPVRVPMDRLRGGVLVAGCAGSGTAGTVRQLLAQATEAGLPWLLADPAGTEYQGLPATVIDPVDPDAVPLTFCPLALPPGCPLPAHLALAGSLLDLALDADERLSLIVTQALRQTYRAAGWDLVTGRPSGPADQGGGQAELPDLRDLHRNLRALIAESGYGRAARARLRGVVDTRFESWLDGPAGRFLTGGHPATPADLGELLGRRVVLATRDLAAADRTLVTGTLLIRLAGHLRAERIRRPQPSAGASLRHLLVLDEARVLLRSGGRGRPAARAAERFAALLPELAAAGVGTVLTERRPALLTPDVTRDPAVRIVHRLPGRADQEAMGTSGGAPVAGDIAMVLTSETAEPVPVRMPAPAEPDVSAAPTLQLELDLEPKPKREPTKELEPESPWPPRQRRSPACGRSCRAEWPCQLAELRTAERLAQSPDQAWLRVWGEILTLAVLTDHPLPAVPAPLRRRWRGLSPRTRECLLGHVLEDAVGRRARALRGHYDPARLTEVLAATATRRLEHTGIAVATVRPGPAWVIPPLRWLHELERLCPLGGTGLTPGDHAGPLDFDLPGLPDWPGIRVGQRIRALRRHPLSMDLAANRQAAWGALIGDTGPEPFAEDLAQVLPGVDAAQALRHTAGLLEVSGGVSGGPGWLEVVLAWPRRFVVFSGDRSRPGHAADGLVG